MPSRSASRSRSRSGQRSLSNRSDRSNRSARSNRSNRSSRSGSRPRHVVARTDTLYIRDYPTDWKESDLRSAVEAYGDIENIVMKEDFAFVMMTDIKDATKAINGLLSRRIDGVRLRVESARSRGGAWKRRAEPLEPSDTLFMVNFAAKTERSDIEDFFEEFHPDSISIQGTYAFITFKTVEDAEDAMREKNGAILGDRTITLEYKAKKRPRREEREFGRDRDYDRERFLPPRGRERDGGWPRGGGGGGGGGGPRWPPAAGPGGGAVPPWINMMQMMGQMGMPDWMQSMMAAGGPPRGGGGGGWRGGGGGGGRDRDHGRDRDRGDRFDRGDRRRNYAPTERLSSREREHNAKNRWDSAPTRPDREKERSGKRRGRSFSRSRSP